LLHFFHVLIGHCGLPQHELIQFVDACVTRWNALSRKFLK
jgi:hypothetical protein